jgi:hypothetical protein
MSTFKFHILLTGLFLYAVAAIAQDATFTAAVSKNPVAADERFTLEFTVTTGGATGKSFKAPDLGKFLVLSGPNQSTSMQIINGAISSSQSYSYILQAREPGTFAIAPATIDVGGSVFKSNGIDITVTKAAGQSSRQQAQQPEQTIEVGDNLFLRAHVDRTRLYQGEQITVTYKIYTRVRIVNYGINKLPTMTGFWGEDLEVPQQVSMSNEVIDGKQYQVGVLKKMALFPTQSGALEINPMELTCQVQVQQQRRRSNDIFDQFFNDPFFGTAQTVNVTVKNDPVKVTVLPLPRQNVPESFKGAVGKFSLKAELNKRSIKTNEPITLKATVNGTGNVKILEAPKLNLPSDFELYEPKISESIRRADDIISGTKSFEWLIVPRYPGEKRIPALEFTYFDIGQKRYVTLKSNEFNVLVEKGSAEAQSFTTGLSRSDVKLLNQDIRFIKTTPGTIRKMNEEFVDPAVAIVITLVPLLAFLGLLVYRHKEITAMSDVVSFRSRRAVKIAAKKLRDAKSLLPSDKTDAFYAEVSNALWQYLSDKLTIDRAELSIDNVTQELREKNVSEDLTAKINECLEACEFSRFAPGGGTQQEKQKMYDMAGSIIVAAEREIGS